MLGRIHLLVVRCATEAGDVGQTVNKGESLTDVALEHYSGVTGEGLFVDDAYHRRGEVGDGVDAGGDSGGLGGGGSHVSADDVSADELCA